MTPPEHQADPSTLRPFIRTLEAGDPITHANLTLVPLQGAPGPARLDYVLAADAIDAHTLTITEVSEAASVPELLAVNEGQTMVLLLDGQHLIGAKQDRILNTTLLLPPKSKTRIPVSCVEQGRWHRVSAAFRTGPYAPSTLRARKSRAVSRSLQTTGLAASNQGAVWDHVADKLVDYAAASPTMALHAVYDQKKDVFTPYLDALPYPSDARGVIVAIAARFVALDLFDNPVTLERVWPDLIYAYAFDAALFRGPADASKPFTAKGAAALLDRLAEIEYVPCPSVGLGDDCRFETDDLLGQALVFDDVCVHLCAFPSRLTPHAARRAPGASPSGRRRGRQAPPDVV